MKGIFESHFEWILRAENETLRKKLEELNLEIEGLQEVIRTMWASQSIHKTHSIINTKWFDSVSRLSPEDCF